MAAKEKGPVRQLAGALIAAVVLRWFRFSPLSMLGSWKPSWFEGTSYSLSVALSVVVLAAILDFAAGKRIDIKPKEYAWIFIFAYFVAGVFGDVLGFIGHFIH